MKNSERSLRPLLIQGKCRDFGSAPIVFSIIDPLSFGPHAEVRMKAAVPANNQPRSAASTRRSATRTSIAATKRSELSDIAAPCQRVGQLNDGATFDRRLLDNLLAQGIDRFSNGLLGIVLDFAADFRERIRHDFPLEVSLIANKFSGGRALFGDKLANIIDPTRHLRVRQIAILGARSRAWRASRSRTSRRRGAS
jgi:hypothetical protein